MGAILEILVAHRYKVSPRETASYVPFDTDDEIYLRLGRDVEVASGTGSAFQADLLLLLAQCSHSRVRDDNSDAELEREHEQAGELRREQKSAYSGRTRWRCNDKDRLRRV